MFEARSIVRRRLLLAYLALALRAAPASADDLGNSVALIRDRYCDTLRVARIALESEDAKRVELSFTSVVVAPDGLVMAPVPTMLLDYPRDYIKSCELLLPGRPGEAIPARLIGVNELFELAFIQPVKPATSQPFADLTAADEPPPVGQPIVCLGLLEQSLGFRCTFELGRVGPAVGTDDFTLSGVPTDATGTLLLTPAGRLTGIARPPELSEEEFLAHGDDTRGGGFIAQPRAARARALARAVAFAVTQRRDWPEPWIGVAGLQVAGRDICEAYGLPPDQVALIIGAVVDGYPAAAAGLHPKDFIIKFNRAALQRGATDDETLAAWTRQLKHLGVGESVILTVWRDGKPLDIPVRLGEAPLTERKAARDFNAQLGMSVREIVFRDRFERRLDRSQHGVVVSQLIQSGPAESAELEDGDIVQKIDDTPTPDLSAYRKVIAEKLAANPSALIFSVRRGSSQQLIIRVEMQPQAGKSDPP